MTAKLIFELINKTLPDTFKDTTSTGKYLSQHFGDKLKRSHNKKGDNSFQLYYSSNKKC